MRLYNPTSPNDHEIWRESLKCLKYFIIVDRSIAFWLRFLNDHEINLSTSFFVERVCKYALGFPRNSNYDNAHFNFLTLEVPRISLGLWRYPIFLQKNVDEAPEHSPYLHSFLLAHPSPLFGCQSLLLSRDAYRRFVVLCRGL